MEGTDVQPVREGHHGLVSGATPRRRPLCLGVSEAAISVAWEAASRDRASAPHGVAGTWRPTSVGSSFPVQVGMDPVTGAEPEPGFIKRNVRVELAVVTRHGCRRGQTSKGSCMTGKASLASSLRRWV